MIILDAYWQSRGDARDDGHMLAKAADTGPGHSMEVVSSLAVLALAVGVLVRLVWRRPDFAGAPLATGFFIGLAVALAVALLVPRWFSAPTADSTEVAKLFDVQRKDIAEIRHDVAGLDSKLGALQAEGEGLNRKVRQIDAQIAQVGGTLSRIEPIVTDTDKFIQVHVEPLQHQSRPVRRADCNRADGVGRRFGCGGQYCLPSISSRQTSDASVGEHQILPASGRHRRLPGGSGYQGLPTQLL